MIRKNIFFAFTLLVCTTLFSQQKLNMDLTNSCSFDGSPITGEIYGFASSNEAISIVDEIVGHIGLKRNFQIQASNVPNAAATIRRSPNGTYERYILYSQNFISRIINRSNSYWAAIGVMAHEIAHHLNGHTLKGPSRPPTELEADEFAGFILYKMGATLEQAQSMFNNSLMYTRYESATHPATSARLEAVAVGYQKAKEKDGKTTVSKLPDYKKNYPNTTTKTNYPNTTTYPKTTTTTKPKTTTSTSNKVFSLVMGKGTGYYGQTWKTSFDFPSDEIKKGWDDNRYITSLTYGDNKWTLVMSKGTKYTTQRWRTRSYFPKDEIKKGWDDGYAITSITYGDGMWALVMSKGSGLYAQQWRTRVNFPKDEIKKGWDDGRQITSLSYGDGTWVLVLSKGSKSELQKWRTRSYFPKDEIKKGWDDGYDITSLTYGDGVWALVLSKGSGLYSQAWRNRTYFPSEEIRKGWDDGKTIISVNYGDN
ncbi:hypothetical protein C8N46_103213 [Kordia periserrulae]|uniref:DUF7477 domain-containing protein n=1 Tax=Kordia periserrulae TaxID=701523 RepID=A0A2T6C1C7_9FLAO|nr:hypothetical protein [Kordia periserrulae]PTX62115.1 hypothetical protein C8N46_103213 [Kordia periserrulae]